MLSLTSIPVTFKEVYTTNMRNFHVNPNWTVTKFLETVTPHLRREFECDEFDIVETGQDAPGIPAEAGRPLESSGYRLKTKWGEDLRIAFYIRRRNYLYPQLQNLNSEQNMTHHVYNADINPIIANAFSVSECPICYENVNTLTRYTCTHSICNQCFHQCHLSDYMICPICRRP